MLSKQCYWKYAKNVLNTDHKVTISSSVSNPEITNIRKYISQSLNFASNCIDDIQLIQQIIQSQKSRKEIITLWNTCMLEELTKFRAGLDALGYDRPERKPKLEMDVSNKLDICSQKVYFLLCRLNEKLKWCLCGRESCPLQLDLQKIRKSVKECFELLKTRKQKGKLTQPFLIFDDTEDLQCQKLTLERIAGKKTSEISSLEFLQTMKVSSDRVRCYYEESWLRTLPSRF